MFYTVKCIGLACLPASPGACSIYDPSKSRRPFYNLSPRVAFISDASGSPSRHGQHVSNNRKHLHGMADPPQGPPRKLLPLSVPGYRIMPPIHLPPVKLRCWIASIIHDDEQGDYVCKITFPPDTPYHGCYATAKIERAKVLKKQIDVFEVRAAGVPCQTIEDGRTEATFRAQGICTRDDVRGRWGCWSKLTYNEKTYPGLVWPPKAMHDAVVEADMQRRKDRVVYIDALFCTLGQKACMVNLGCKVEAIIYGCGRSGNAENMNLDERRDVRVMALITGVDHSEGTHGGHTLEFKASSIDGESDVVFKGIVMGTGMSGQFRKVDV